jgi:hypothetical protein
MELKGSLTYSQEPTTRTYPESEESISDPDTLLFKNHFNIILLSRLDFSCGFFLSDFPTKILYAYLTPPMRALCPAHLILFELITLLIYGEG